MRLAFEEYNHHERSVVCLMSSMILDWSVALQTTRAFGHQRTVSPTLSLKVDKSKPRSVCPEDAICRQRKRSTFFPKTEVTCHNLCRHNMVSATSHEACL